MGTYRLPDSAGRDGDKADTAQKAKGIQFTWKKKK